MWRRDVDHAADPRVRTKEQAVAHELEVSLLASHLADGTIADRPPEPVAGIDGDHLAEQAAHAVADEHHPVDRGVALVRVEPPAYLVEGPPEEIARVGDRGPGRVAERPELEAAVEGGIGREGLDHPAPRRRPGPQPVHEDDRHVPAHVGTRPDPRM